MSNVLVGIIGVILFIGLALAGALYLGPRFNGAQAESRASAYMLQLKQITDAAALRLSQGGGPVGDTEADVDALKTEGFLKGDLSAYDFSALEGGSHATVAYRQMTDTPQNRAVCEAIQRAYGQTKSGSLDTTSRLLRETTTQQGCIAWRFRANSLAIYVKI